MCSTLPTVYSSPVVRERRKPSQPTPGGLPTGFLSSPTKPQQRSGRRRRECETGGMATASSFAAVFFSSAFAACLAEVLAAPPHFSSFLASLAHRIRDPSGMRSGIQLNWDYRASNTSWLLSQEEFECKGRPIKEDCFIVWMPSAVSSVFIIL